MQFIYFILDKILKPLTYYTPFYHQSLQSYLILKNNPFLLAHPVYICFSYFNQGWIPNQNLTGTPSHPLPFRSLPSPPLRSRPP